MGVKTRWNSLLYFLLHMHKHLLKMCAVCVDVLAWRFTMIALARRDVCVHLTEQVFKKSLSTG